MKRIRSSPIDCQQSLIAIRLSCLLLGYLLSAHRNSLGYAYETTGLHIDIVHLAFDEVWTIPMIVAVVVMLCSNTRWLGFFAFLVVMTIRLRYNVVSLSTESWLVCEWIISIATLSAFRFAGFRLKGGAWNHKRRHA